MPLLQNNMDEEIYDIPNQALPTQSHSVRTVLKSELTDISLEHKCKVEASEEFLERGESCIMAPLLPLQTTGIDPLMIASGDSSEIFPSPEKFQDSEDADAQLYISKHSLTQRNNLVASAAPLVSPTSAQSIYR